MSDSLSIVNFKNKTIQDELEIGQFWLELRKKIYKASADHSMITFTETRRHQSATGGAYAGILLAIFITRVPVVYTYYEIRQAISKPLKKSRKKGRVVRIKNLQTLENLCRYDLIVKNCVSDAQLVSASRQYNEHATSSSEKDEFFFEGPLIAETAVVFVL